VTDYYCAFLGHLLPATKPEGWDDVVKDEFIYRSDTPEGVMNFINDRAGQMKRDGGMTIILKPTTPEEKKKDAASIFSRGALVPMHMFQYVTYEIRPLVQMVPDVTSPDTMKN